jgi:serine/threonine protein kinase
MSIILYATLSGRLPFDHPSVPRLLQAIQKGNYHMANAIGPEAADLIKRMLQDRGGINPRSPDVQYCERPVNRVSDKEIMRHLKSLWHQFEDKQLVTLLLYPKRPEALLWPTLTWKWLMMTGSRH